MTDTPASAAGTWTLGDRTVNRLGFGAMRLSGTGGMGQGEDRDPEQSAAVVRRAVELGVNHMDTAGFYFSATGRANEIIRAALAPYPDDLTIATKVGPGRDLVTGDWGDWVDARAQLRDHVEHNLETLGLDRLHVVNYRSNGRDDVAGRRRRSGGAAGRGAARAHRAVQRRGRRRWPRPAGSPRSSCVQNRHAAGYERSDSDDVLAACRDGGDRVRPVLHHRRLRPARGRRGGAVRRRPVDRRRPRRDAGPGAHRVDAGTRRPHVLAIPGTGDVGHLEQNVAAASLRLTEDERALLSALESGRAVGGA